MAVSYFWEERAPTFLCLSTDVSGSKVSGISYIGSRVFFTDTGTQWIVNSDLKLVPYAENIVGGTSGSSAVLSGSTVNVTNFPTTFSGSVTNFPANPMVRVETEITNTAGSVTAYSIGDVVSGGSTIVAPYELANVFNAVNGSAFIFGLAVSTNKSSQTPAFRVHFFNNPTAVIPIDNAPFMDLYSDQSKKLRYFDLPAMTSSTNTSGSCSRAFDVSTIRHPIIAGSATTSLYFALETLSVFTSASAIENYTVSAMIARDL
jgi:hypothetical protein